jgi:hypothetical protein
LHSNIATGGGGVVVGGAIVVGTALLLLTIDHDKVGVAFIDMLPVAV